MSRTIELPGMHADHAVQGDWIEHPPVGLVLPNDVRSEFYERPYGFYSYALRQAWIDSSLRFAGVGGGGLAAVVQAAKEGSCDIAIADPEKVENSNIGRIPYLKPGDAGKYKVDIAAELITEMNPMATVRIYGDGINPKNVEEFLGYDADNKGLTIAYDEIELREPGVARLFHRNARWFGRYVISATDVGRGGTVTVYDPQDPESTFERYMGADINDSDEEYVRKVNDIKLPTIPYVPDNSSWGTFRSIMKGASAPTTLRSVNVATTLLLDETERLMQLHICERGALPPTFSPNMHVVDPSRNVDYYTDRPRRTFMRQFGGAVLNTLRGQGSTAAYTMKEIRGRRAYRLAHMQQAQRELGR